MSLSACTGWPGRTPGLPHRSRSSRRRSCFLPRSPPLHTRLAGRLAEAQVSGLGVLPTVAAAAGFAVSGWPSRCGCRTAARTGGRSFRGRSSSASGWGCFNPCGLPARALCAREQGVYGSFGIAAALLLGLFFVGRLIVVRSGDDATLWQRRERRRSRRADDGPDPVPPRPAKLGHRGGRRRRCRTGCMATRTQPWPARAPLVTPLPRGEPNSGAGGDLLHALGPADALVVIAFFNLAANEYAFSNRLIAHMKLDGATANLFASFGSTSNNVLAATLTIVFGFLLWGLGIGQVYRTSTHAPAHPGRSSRPGAVHDLVLRHERPRWADDRLGLDLRSDGWLVLIPAWIQLDDLLALDAALPAPPQGHARRLLPGALLASLVLGATVATAPLWFGPTVNENARASAPSAS